MIILASIRHAAYCLQKINLARDISGLQHMWKCLVGCHRSCMSILHFLKIWLIGCIAYYDIPCLHWPANRMHRRSFSTVGIITIGFSMNIHLVFFVASWIAIALFSVIQHLHLPNNLLFNHFIFMNSAMSSKSAIHTVSVVWRRTEKGESESFLIAVEESLWLFHEIIK